MGITNLRSSLEKKYATLTGELAATNEIIGRIQREMQKLPELQAKIPELEELVQSTGTLLKSIIPDWSPDHIPPVKPWSHTLPVPFGQCGRRGLNVVRQSKVPLTTRQICFEVLRGIGIEDPDQITIRKTTVALEASLRHHRGKTVESSGKYPMQWRSIINPDIEFDP